MHLLFKKKTGLWGIVNNAGILGYFGPMAWYTPQEFMETLNVNVGGIVRVTTELLPLLKQGKDVITLRKYIVKRLFIGGFKKKKQISE